jgi:dienelactone hydrolase
MIGALALVAALTPVLVFPAQAASPVAVTLKSADGVRVAARFYSASAARATILLFHQAGASKDEYATIAPRLVALGYDVLAIDQRSGGSLFGGNETVRALGHSTDYLAARSDLRAALTWAANRHRPVIVWGSSYSASLVFLLAAAHPDQIAAILAFSPGEYLPDKTMVSRAAARIRVPVFVTAASDAEETRAARAILAATHAPGRTFFAPKAGVHGASTLVARHNPAGAAPNWQAVERFLSGLKLPRRRSTPPVK